MGISAAVAPSLGLDAGGAGALDPLLRREGEAVEAGLHSNPVEFDGIKTGVVDLLPETEKFERVAVAQPVADEVVTGIQSKAGRYGGTYAHLDIALEFAAWISVEFKLYLIKEFQRLKETERQTLGWDIRRNLARINYRIQTDAIQTHLIPPALSKAQTSLVYASEADVLNMALFGQTAAQWRGQNPGKKGNIRDQASGAQLVCLSNLENLNALFIGQALLQSERLTRLNQIAIQQMKLLTADERTPRLAEGKEGK